MVNKILQITKTANIDVYNQLSTKFMSYKG